MPTRAESVAELRQAARTTLEQLRAELLDERCSSENSSGHWCGELAASALSTATAISAISAVVINDANTSDIEWKFNLIGRGLRYLRSQQNDDGGFGDTDRSHSNIATSYLVLAAYKLAKDAIEKHSDAENRDANLSESQLGQLRRYIRDNGEIEGLKKRYGKDKTFVVPILTNMAIAGLVKWSVVSPLPFEAAVFPQSWYRFLRMPVVSYAIPALVAIGQARHFLGPKSWFFIRSMRSASVKRTMNVLHRMQPESGGYLEATPLTSFVLMSLAATGRGETIVAKNAFKFLRESVTDNGSWPIDTNLATWVTSLSVHALSCDPDDDGSWCSEKLVRWHLDCQHRERHPFTGADPGGWGWTDLSGAVPDADDTPAAILALGQMRKHVDPALNKSIADARLTGVHWLQRLQNRDGGWPTFCRGWGKLPFDRSSTDLTAHACRARNDSAEFFMQSTGSEMLAELKATDRAVEFLHRSQQPDGSWLPLWFGNQDLPDEINPVYGTSKVLMAGIVAESSENRGCEFLRNSINADGGWGGGPSLSGKLHHLKSDRAEFAEIKIPDGLVSSVEETALAVEALSTLRLFRRDREISIESDTEIAAESENPAVLRANSGVLPEQANEVNTAGGNDPDLAAIISGVQFLIDSVRDRRHRVAWPIGFYFAKLWYHERLYPLIFTVAALGKFLRATADQHDPDWPK